MQALKGDWLTATKEKVIGVVGVIKKAEEPSAPGTIVTEQQLSVMVRVLLKAARRLTTWILKVVVVNKEDKAWISV